MVEPGAAMGWLARFRSWSSRSISNQITASAIALTLAVATIISVTAFLAVGVLISRNISAALDGQARLAEQRLALDLSLAARDLADLAQNSFIANGLVDSLGRDTYLLPFLREHRLPVSAGAALVLCDFKGTPIASNQPAPPALPGALRGPTEVLANARSYAEVLDEAGGVQLYMSHPVIFPPTRRTEGVIVEQLDLARLFASATGGLGPDLIAALTVNGLVVGAGESERPVLRAGVRRRLDLPEMLGGLDVTLVVGTRAQVYSPLRWAAIVYLLVGVVLVVIVFRSSRAMARRLSAPIEALSRTASRIAAGGELEMGQPVGGTDEVGALESAIAAMLGKLRSSHEDLEARIRDRTTELQRREKELERYAETQVVLLHEVNHRVKNNLSAIIGVLHLEGGYAAKRQEEAVAAILGELEQRIRSLATVHALLSGAAWQPLPLGGLCHRLLRTTLGEARTPGLRLQVEPSVVQVDSGQAHHLALVLNELATNTLKYGRSPGGEVRVVVGFGSEGGDIVLTYRDHGPGFPPAVMELSPETTGTGLQLLRGLVEASLAGSLALSNDGGAVTTIRFPCSSTPSEAAPP
jgi:two-component sensor histidine kinase